MCEDLISELHDRIDKLTQEYGFDKTDQDTSWTDYGIYSRIDELTKLLDWAIRH